MENTSDSLFRRIHTLAVGLLDCTLSSAEREELESMLLTNAAARRAYFEHMQESACLTWLCVEELGADSRPMATTRSPSESTRSWRRAAAAVCGGILASVLVAMIGMQFLGRFPNVGPVTEIASDIPRPPAGEVGTTPTASGLLDPADSDRAVVATITSLAAAQWVSPSTGARVLSRWAVGDRLRLRSGSAELTFDAGAQVTIFGPAEFEITSATSIRCLRGRITTLVDKRGRGFFIETPRAKVVDLGTQFGLSISDEGETEVVVFQGSVDLSYSPQPSAGDATSRRMRQGEALLVKNSGEFERVVAVQRNSFMTSAGATGGRSGEPVIGDVWDNIRNAQSPVKSYQIVHGGFTDDALAFVDRSHQWNGLDSTGLPAFLAGADYIMPFNDDKFVRGLAIKVRLRRPATLYVFLDNNMAEPEWLREGFKDTGVDIGLDCGKTEWHKDHALGIGSGRSVDFGFSVWKRDVKQAGTVELGGLVPPEVRSQGFNMYGIAAVATN